MAEPKTSKEPSGAGEGPSDAEIDEALVESFPASDPLPWTLGVDPHYPTGRTSRQPEHEKDKREPQG